MGTKYTSNYQSDASFFSTTRKPRDERSVVKLRSDLINPETWNFQSFPGTESGYLNDRVYIGMLVAVVEDTEDNNGLYMFVGNYSTGVIDPADYWNDYRYWKKLAFAVDVDNVTSNWIPDTNPTQVHVQKVGGGEFGIQSDPTLDLSNSDYLSNINL